MTATNAFVLVRRSHDQPVVDGNSLIYQGAASIARRRPRPSDAVAILRERSARPTNRCRTADARDASGRKRNHTSQRISTLGRSPPEQRLAVTSGRVDAVIVHHLTYARTRSRDGIGDISPRSHRASFVHDIITLDLARESRGDDREGPAGDNSRHG